MLREEFASLAVGEAHQVDERREGDPTLAEGVEGLLSVARLESGSFDLGRRFELVAQPPRSAVVGSRSP